MRPRSLLVLFLLILATAVGHHVVLFDWYVEDAAISFAYARNLADGQGLVPYPAAERIEGYSNPSWVFLLAAAEWVGLSAWDAARWLALVLCMATVVIVHRLVREATQRSEIALLAAALLALNSSFAIWGSSGLENALFGCLQAAGMASMLHEVRIGRRVPLSAGFFVLLAITRPEAPVYVALAGLAYAAWVWRDRRGVGSIVGYAAVLVVPLLAYHAWRYVYFAWPFPNTYYAKFAYTERAPFAWSGAPWTDVRDFSVRLGHVFLAPVYALGLVGSRRWRLALLAAVPLGLAILAGETGERWVSAIKPVSDLVPPVVVGGLAVFLPFRSVKDTPQGRAALLSWLMVAASVLFAVGSVDDWMKGWRWMSFATVPLSILLALGLAELGDRLAGWGRWPGGVWGVLGVLLTAFGITHGSFTLWFADNPITTPESVHRRVRYTESVQAKVHAKQPVYNLDVDQGAHLWFSDDWMIDFAGLIDVPFAHNAFDPTFLEQYILEERKPAHAHLHAEWERRTGITRLPGFKKDYLEIPGYPSGATRFHTGNWIRRDLLMAPAWPWKKPRREEFGDLVLEGWDAPSPEAVAGRYLYLETGWSMRRRTEANTRVVGFLAGASRERVFAFDLPLGYGWLEPHEWRPDEIFHGKFDIRLPEWLPEGVYDLGFVVMDDSGFVREAADPHTEPRYAHGEVRWNDAIKIVDRDRLSLLAKSDRNESAAFARKAQCEQAEHFWWLASMHRSRDRRWHDEWEGKVRAWLADCWVVRARMAEDFDKKVLFLTRAHRQYHGGQTLRRQRRIVGDKVYDQAMAARAAGEHAEAHRLFTALLGFDPQRSWARRYAEAARAAMNADKE